MRCFPVYQDEQFMNQMNHFMEISKKIWNHWTAPKKTNFSEEEEKKEIKKPKIKYQKQFKISIKVKEVDHSIQ
jgi:hypothetical protein